MTPRPGVPQKAVVSRVKATLKDLGPGSRAGRVMRTRRGTVWIELPSGQADVVRDRLSLELDRMADVHQPGRMHCILVTAKNPPVSRDSVLTALQSGAGPGASILGGVGDHIFKVLLPKRAAFRLMRARQLVAANGCVLDIRDSGAMYEHCYKCFKPGHIARHCRPKGELDAAF